jgi:uncharacterized membrane protein
MLTMGRFFWIITALFLAIAIHISYVLFVPGLLFQRKLYALTDGKPYNSFFIMSPEKQSQLFPTATADDVVGLCKFDLGAGRLVLSAQLPKTYWTLSIYTQSGKQLYALDDAQAGASTFTVDLSRAKTVLQQLFAKNDGEETGQIENLGWKVETTEQRGLAVVWIPLADALMRTEVENTIKVSKCEPKAAGG